VNLEESEPSRTNRPRGLTAISTKPFFNKSKEFDMKKLLVIGVLFVVFLESCATVRVEAPGKSDIKLATETSPYNYVMKKKVFYILWGLVPITDNSTASMLAGKDVSEVRVLTYYDVVDAFVSYVLGWLSIHSKTVEIQAKVQE